MIWIYRLLFLPTLLISLPYYVFRMLKRGGYGRDFQHRFGLVPKLPCRQERSTRIWIQAVSVGELNALGPILEELQEHPGIEILITTTTSTGYVIAQVRYQDLITKVAYFPLDFWPFSWLAWRRFDADLAILMEGEVWPEHLYQARQRQIPIILINARISDRSYARYRLLALAAERLFENMTLILAATPQDRERFSCLGISEDRVRLTGSLKCDVPTGPLLSETEKTKMREEMRLQTEQDEEPPLIFLASSTWPGEEAAATEAFKAAKLAQMNCRLLIVPRHVERRQEIGALLKQEGLSFNLRSGGTPQSPTQITLGDTTGELKMLTQLADLVFVGKSLPPQTEGQTPIEAAALGKPMIFGPGMSNFRNISETLLGDGAAVEVANAGELTDAVVALLRDPERRRKMAGAALSWHRANLGAAHRTVNAILKVLKRNADQSSALTESS